MTSYTRTSDGFSSPSISAPWFNVRDFGAVGIGIGNDAAAIDAALASLIGSSTGGILYFPAGRYVYTNGAGLVNNPDASTLRPLRILGDGPGVTQITVNGTLTNAEFIRLDSQSTFGAGLNYGSGVEGMKIILDVVGKDCIVIDNQEKWHIRNVFLAGQNKGTNAIHVIESARGICEVVTIGAFKGSGIKITGDTFSANWYEKIIIVNTNSAGGGTGWAFDYSKTTATDAGGLTLRDVTITSAGAGGFRFASTVADTPMFVFMESCIVDSAAENLGGDGFYFQNCLYAALSNNWSVINTASKAAFHFDASGRITMTGGHAAGIGASGADLKFFNSCTRITVDGTITFGGQTAVLTDATTHSSVTFNIPSPVTGVGVSDATKFTSTPVIEGLNRSNTLKGSLIADSAAVANTTVQTAFNKTVSVPVGALNVAGTVVCVTASGFLSTTGTPSLTIRARIGSTIFAGVGSVTGNNSVDVRWNFQAMCTVRAIGGSGSVQRGFGIGGVTTGAIVATTIAGSTFTLDTTVAQTVDITAQWTVADPSNTVDMDTFTVDAVPPRTTVS